ncbi:MAG: GNAT family N-acetyltransferase [bacterium]
MYVELAHLEDLDALIEIRIAYLREDHGIFDEAPIREGLRNYYPAHLNNDLYVYVIKEDGMVVSSAFLLVVEKPMSPAFVNGKTGIILNVYTQPSYRRRGYAHAIMEHLLKEAKQMNVTTIELQATDAGYPLYRSVGFIDEVTKYHRMKWYHPDIKKI